MLAEKSKVYNLSGQSFEDALFNKQTNPLEGEIEKWMSYMLSEEKKGEKELFLKMLAQNGKIENKDLLSFQRKIKDVLRWIWINTFLFGDREIREEAKFAQNETDVAEFAINWSQLSIGDLKELIGKLDERIDRESDRKEITRLKDRRRTVINRLQKLEEKLSEKKANRLYDKTIDKTLPVVEEVKENKPTPVATPEQRQSVITNTPQQKLESVTPLTTEERLIANRQKDKLRKKAERSRERNVQLKYKDTFLPTDDEEKDRVLADVERLRKMDKKQQKITAQITPEGFINNSDFGRIYVEQRADYIAQTYTGKRKQRMLNVYDAMQKDYEAGTGNPIIQEYFEKGKIEKVNGRMTIKGQQLTKETDQKVTVNGKTYTLAGNRIDPSPEQNNDDLRNLNLYDKVYKQTLTDGNLRSARSPTEAQKQNKFGFTISELAQTRRIVETEVAAAYNMGRLHAMYTRNVKFVRWINDRENESLGKVCMICKVRAMGTSKTLRNANTKETLSGIYTLEEIMTDRQLAQPQHPMCACYVRPLTTQEDKVIASILNIPLSEMVLDAAGVATIAGVSVEGLNNRELAKEGGDRTNWWKGVAAVGATAAGMGLMSWYLRKSLTTAYAADFLKKRSKSIITKANVMGGTIIPREVPTDELLEKSLKLTDDQRLTSKIDTQWYTGDEMKKYGVRIEPLPDLSKLKRDAPELNIPEANIRDIDDGLEHVLVTRLVLQDIETNPVLPDIVKLYKLRSLKRYVDEGRASHNLYGEEFVPQELLQETKERIEDLGLPAPDLSDVQPEWYVPSNEYGRWYKHISVEYDRADDQLRFLEDRLTKKAETSARFTPQEVQNVNNIFENLELLSGGSKKKKIKEYFSNLQNDIDDLLRTNDRLARKRTITKKELTAIKAKVDKLRVERDRVKRALERSDDETTKNLFETVDAIKASNDRTLPRISDELETAWVYRNTLDVEIAQTLEKLGELKKNSSTYGEKLIDGEVVDRFVGEITNTNKSKTNLTNLKSLAINRRKIATKQLENMLRYLNRKEVDIQLDPGIQQRLALILKNDIVEKVGDIDGIREMIGDDFVNTFLTSDKNDKIKFIQILRDKIITEQRTIRDAEFNRFQQKWAMFGSPK